MGKSIDHHSVQILNISRFQQKLRAEEALAKLNQGGVLLKNFAHTIVLKESSVSELNFRLQEVFEVKEALDAQSSLSKRQRAEMEAMAHEMSALKVSKLKHEPSMIHQLLLLPEIEPEPEERAEADQHSGRRRSPGRTCSILNHILSNFNRQTCSLNCLLSARL